MEREGKAVWSGNLKSGSGTLSTQSRTLSETPYSFVSRFEQGKGTNPEELIAAAHSGCFSMALSKELESSGVRFERIETTARVSLDQIDGNWSIHAVHLRLEVRAPGADASVIRAAADRAKSNCPVSRLLKANITLDIQGISEKAA